MLEVITIFGAVCSGKTTEMNLYPKTFRKVDVGDIVRSITSTQARIHNKDLDIQIIDEINREIHYAATEKYIGIVIIGIRQLTILNAIEAICDTLNFKLHRLLLIALPAILKARYIKRAANKDTKLTFEDCIERDFKIGYDEVLEYLQLVNTHVKINYTEDEEDALQTGE